MPYCSQCGSQNSDNARFCSQCGTPLAQPAGDPAPHDSTATITFGAPAKSESDERASLNPADAAAVDGNVGVAQWTATFTAASSGAKIELNGVFVLEFTATGLVSELREWWVLRP